jgi:hypothetical protein
MFRIQGRVNMAATLTLALLLSSVHVSVDQDGGLSSAQVRLLAGQMQEIWQDAGVAVTSGRHEDSRPGHALISLRILRISPPSNSTPVRPILAWVAFEPTGRLAPQLLVSLPAITSLVSTAEFAGYRVRRLTRQMHDELLARAIGRAAAHELGHYLLQRAGHQARGLMRASYSASDLVGDWLQPFQVLPDDRPVVRSEIAALVRAQTASLDHRVGLRR